MVPQMPQVDVDRLDLSEDDKTIARMVVARGRLRASAPPTRPRTYENGLAYYVWRMAAFSVSPHAQHHCMPMTCWFYLPPEYSWGSDLLEAALKRGDRIEDAIVKSIPHQQWGGIIRWGQAFGRIGSPQVAGDGSIIYR